MSRTIKQKYFHISGMKTSDQKDGIKGDPNYVQATLGYDSIKWGLYWDIRPVHKYMIEDVEMVAAICGCAVATPMLKETLVECKRFSKKKEAEAIELFDCNVISAIQNRLKYKVEAA